LHADMVSSQQAGRFVIYTANFTTMNALLGFLTENCCGGNPCAPVCTPACSTEKEPS
jgi:ArsR family transcriptional regulator